MKPFRSHMCPHLSQCACPGLGFLLVSSSTEAPKRGVCILWGPVKMYLSNSSSRRDCSGSVTNEPAILEPQSPHS